MCAAHTACIPGRDGNADNERPRGMCAPGPLANDSCGRRYLTETVMVRDVAAKCVASPACFM